MFKEQLKNDIDRICPAPGLLDEVSLMMTVQALKPRRGKYTAVIRCAAAAAAVFLVSFAAIKLGAFNGNSGINTLGGVSEESVDTPDEEPERSVPEMFSLSDENADAKEEISDVSPETEETEISDESNNGIMTAEARGGDELIPYRYPLNALIGAISVDFIEMAGEDEFVKWAGEKEAEADFSDIEKQVNLYSFINDFDIDREAAEKLLYRYMEIWRENGIEPNYTERDIEILLYGSKEEVAENFAADGTVYHNGKLYTPEWFNTHTAEAYAAEGIPAEKIKEKLGNMLECARVVSLDVLAEEVGRYIGEKVEIPVFEPYVYTPDVTLIDDTFIEVDGSDIASEEIVGRWDEDE